MYIQNKSLSLPAAYEERSLPSDVSLETKPRHSAQADTSLQTSTEKQNYLPITLKNISERAALVFESLTAQMDPQAKKEAAEALSSIAKSAAFAATQGYESQADRQLVNRYFDSFSGVLSDDAIKKMILSVVGSSHKESRAFLEKFASAIDAPLQRINIRI